MKQVMSILALAGIITTLVTIEIHRTPSTYRATAQIEVAKDTGTTVVSTKDFVVQADDSDNINTKLVIIKSRPLLEDVAELLTSMGITSRIYTEYDGQRTVEILGYQSTSRGSHRLELPTDERITYHVSGPLREAADRLLAARLAYFRLVGRSAIELPVTVELAEDAMQKKAVLYDKEGDKHYDYISAWIKSARGSDPDAAMYYLLAMLEGGEDARFIARRMVVFASEDIGNADPQALVVAVAAAQAVEHVGLPEAQLNLAQAAVYLARAPKSNASAVAIWEARRDVREHGNLRPPAMLRDAHYPAAKLLGHGEGYVYPHDDPRGFDLEYLPEELAGRRYYRESGNGEEGDRGGPDRRQGT